ncbi:MAG: pyridoxal phosphate-dependent aminotransferase [Candidatus Omnitrophica bacterium]|nr:pyridoxal phosphate-dependent aminotransferase [Candidatus Omnitrophota bacterium]
MARISSRTAGFQESVIRRMTRVAQQTGAVNLSQGFPDFDPPQPLMEALRRTAEKGPHQYAVTWGAANFREALAQKQGRFTGLPIDPESHIVVTCGSTEAMMAAMMSVTEPGDKVIVFSPFYENYAADAVLTGAEPLYVPLLPPSFEIDVQALRAAFAQGPRAVILCNPGNPTGKVFRRDELLEIGRLAEAADAWVITDEVYEHIVYEPCRHTYFAALPGMFERTITCGSLSKTFSITGWRLGYLIAPESVVQAARKIHDFLTVGAPAPLQEAAVTALQFPDEYYAGLKDRYARQRSLFLNILCDAKLKHTEPEGAYYVLADISEFGAPSDTWFAEWMAREAGVAAVPGSSFFHEKEDRYVRFHFAKKEETLIEAGRRLKKIRELYRPGPTRPKGA